MFKKFTFGVLTLALVLCVGVLSMGFSSSSPPTMVSPMYSGSIFDQGEICVVRSFSTDAELPLIVTNYMSVSPEPIIDERWTLQPRTLGILFDVGKGTYFSINPQPIIV